MSIQSVSSPIDRAFPVPTNVHLGWYLSNPNVDNAPAPPAVKKKGSKKPARKKPGKKA